MSSGGRPLVKRAWPGCQCNVDRLQELLPGPAVLRVEGESLDDDGVEAPERVGVGLGRQFAVADGLVEAVFELEGHGGSARLDAGDDRIRGAGMRQWRLGDEGHADMVRAGRHLDCGAQQGLKSCARGRSGGNPVTWTGNFRPPLHGATITPRTGRALPVRLGVGGTAASAARAARLGLPMTLARLLGSPLQAKPVADLYWQTGQELGHKADELGIGIVSHFHVGTTSQTARDTFYPHYRSYVSDGRGIHITRPAFDGMTSPHGALMVGSPQEIIDKIMLEHEFLHLDRFMGQIDLGGLSRADALRSIELFATEVAPVLRRELT